MIAMAGLIATAILTLISAYYGWYLVTDIDPVPRARPAACGALHTAIWSLAAAIYLSLGPDVGVVGTNGPGWILMAATTAMYFFLLWVWADPTAKVG